MRTRSLVVFVLICLPWRATSAQDTVLGVAAQPLKAQVRRVFRSVGVRRSATVSQDDD